MRRIVYILPLLLLLQVNTRSVGQTSTPLIDTARINALKDSIRVKLNQILDVELLSACLKVRQIECVGAITLLAPNEPLRDAIASFKEGYGTNVLVHSYISSNQLWPRLFFNASRMASDITDPGVKPAVGFDVRFTPQGARGQRKYAVEVGNQSTPELLTDAQRTQLTSAIKRGLTGAFDGVNTAAVDSTNASLLSGIDQLRSFWEASLAQCNLKGVRFAPSANPKFGFDAMPSEALKEYYTRLTVRGRDYYAPWQSIAANASEEVAIKVELQDGNPPTHPVAFRSSTGKTPSVRSNGDNTYAVTLLGGSEGSEETIEAFYTDTLPGGRTKQIVIGALRVRAYAPAQRRVVPVILNRASLGVSPTALQETLNGIYQQAAVSWTVEPKIEITVTQSEWDTDDRDGVLLVETSPFNRYSSEMQAIIDRIKDLPTYDPEASYLIVTDLPNSMGYAGYMPLKSDFAFIFTRNEAEAYKTMAHELGHGAFYLKHPQDEYRILEGTDNLMDRYAVGRTLWKPQWDWIGDPSWRLYAFQQESEGAMFEITLHEEMINSLLANKSELDEIKSRTDIKKFLIHGVGDKADTWLGALRDNHFDGRTTYDEIQSDWNDLQNVITSKILGINNSMKNRSLDGYNASMSFIAEFAVCIHKVQDFYAHSNYVELFISYYKNKHNGDNPISIPLFSSRSFEPDFLTLMKTSGKDASGKFKGLYSGSFSYFDNEYYSLLQFLNPLEMSTVYLNPNSHFLTNKDKAINTAGVLAYNAALEETFKLLLILNENISTP